MKTYLLFISSFISCQVTGQVLILKDYSVIEFKKMDWDKDEVELILMDGGSIKKDPNTIAGVYNKKAEREFFYCPTRPDNENRRFVSMDRIAEGYINVLEYTVSGPSGAYSVPNSTTYTFLEKGGECTEVRRTKEFRESFYSFLGDSENYKEVLQPDTLQLTSKRVLEIVKGYNISAFKKPTRPAYKNTSSVMFYTKVKSKTKDHLKLLINDSLEYNLPSGYPLAIHLPVTQPSKVCFISPTGQICDIISGSPATIKYFELKFNSKQNSFTIEQKTRIETQKFIANRKK